MKMFPKTKFVEEKSAWVLYKQLDHMQSELIETLEALEMYLLDPTEENRKRLIEEILDLKHSADTELYNLGVTEEEHIRESNEVIKKNYDRGYYEKGE